MKLRSMDFKVSGRGGESVAEMGDGWMRAPDRWEELDGRWARGGGTTLYAHGERVIRAAAGRLPVSLTWAALGKRAASGHVGSVDHVTTGLFRQATVAPAVRLRRKS